MPYVDPAQVQQLRQIDLYSYLRDNDPDELIKISANTYSTKTHDSLKISNGKWYWWSRGIGGQSALDYLIKVKEMGFLDAVDHLQNRTTLILSPPETTTTTIPKERTFAPPQKSRDSSKALAYLKHRKIDPRIISECARKELIYENKSHGYSNVAFIGTDEKGVPRYAALRGCFSDYKGEAPGSDKRYSFKLASHAQNDVVHFFESAIDALSYASLLLLQDKNWKEENLVSLGGIPPASKTEAKQLLPTINQYLIDNPHTKTIYLCLDNDEAGVLADAAIASTLPDRFDVRIKKPRFAGKDWNELLVAQHSLPSQKQLTRSERER